MRVINRLVIRAVMVSGVTTAALLSPSVTLPSAAAAPCTDVQVIFARGTFEAPGVGGVGQAFVDSLRSKIGDKSMDVYPVNYPASLDFATAADGVIDARNKVQDVANTCPDTEIVLGGFSQGAAVAGYITADAVPPGFTLPQGITGPMPSNVADHVAAVALFGKPSNGFLQTINTAAPPITVGSLYSGKTLDLCAPADAICSPGGGDGAAHNSYPVNGMTDQAATYAAQHVSAASSESSH
jgi:cutinase